MESPQSSTLPKTHKHTRIHNFEMRLTSGTPHSFRVSGDTSISRCTFCKATASCGVYTSSSTCWSSVLLLVLFLSVLLVVFGNFFVVLPAAAPRFGLYSSAPSLSADKGDVMAISQSITDDELDDLRLASSLLITLLSSLESCLFLFVSGETDASAARAVPLEVMFRTAKNSSGGLSNAYEPETGLAIFSCLISDGAHAWCQTWTKERSLVKSRSFLFLNQIVWLTRVSVTEYASWAKLRSNHISCGATRLSTKWKIIRRSNAPHPFSCRV